MKKKQKKSLIKTQWFQGVLILLAFCVLLAGVVYTYNARQPDLPDDIEVGQYIMKRSKQIKNMYNFHRRTQKKLSKISFSDPELKRDFERLDYGFEHYYRRYVEELMDAREDFDDYKQNNLHMRVLDEMKDTADQIFERVEKLYIEERDLVTSM